MIIERCDVYTLNGDGDINVQSEMFGLADMCVRNFAF